MVCRKQNDKTFRYGVKRQTYENKALGKGIPLFTARVVTTPKRILVDALTATTGPKVAEKPIVEATPTRAATTGPTTIESITETREAKVAE